MGPMLAADLRVLKTMRHMTTYSSVCFKIFVLCTLCAITVSCEGPEGPEWTRKGPSCSNNKICSNGELCVRDHCRKMIKDGSDHPMLKQALINKDSIYHNASCWTSWPEVPNC